MTAVVSGTGVQCPQQNRRRNMVPSVKPLHHYKIVTTSDATSSIIGLSCRQATQQITDKNEARFTSGGTASRTADSGKTLREGQNFNPLANLGILFSVRSVKCYNLLQIKFIENKYFTISPASEGPCQVSKRSFWPSKTHPRLGMVHSNSKAEKGLFTN